MPGHAARALALCSSASSADLSGPGGASCLGAQGRRAIHVKRSSLQCEGECVGRKGSQQRRRRAECGPEQGAAGPSIAEC